MGLVIAEHADDWYTSAHRNCFGDTKSCLRIGWWDNKREFQTQQYRNEARDLCWETLRSSASQYCSLLWSQCRFAVKQYLCKYNFGSVRSHHSGLIRKHVTFLRALIGKRGAEGDWDSNPRLNPVVHLQISFCKMIRKPIFVFSERDGGVKW